LQCYNQQLCVIIPTSDQAPLNLLTELPRYTSLIYYYIILYITLYNHSRSQKRCRVADASTALEYEAISLSFWLKILLLRALCIKTHQRMPFPD